MAKDRASLVIDNGKEYLVETRLTPVAEGEGFSSLQELVQAMRNGSPSKLLQDKAIDALTTNETLFFRDFHPFEALRGTAIPNLIEARKTQRELKIWSAACSSGQEAFSFAMMLRESFPTLRSWKISILGTDISGKILEDARKAEYRQIEVNRGLPATLLVKYFEASGGKWKLREEIRSMVQFQHLNLASSWPMLPRFDLIMIRNVMIYFDAETKARILNNAAFHLAPDGYLILGSAETPVTVTNRFVPVGVGKATFYQLAEQAL